MSSKFRPLIITTLLVSICLLNTGCAGMLMRNAVLGEGTYSELSGTLPSIQDGKGRVFLYLAKGGPNLWNTAGIFTTLSIDDRIYNIAGETFFYVDLRIGKHQVTSSSASKMSKGAINLTYVLGENVVEFELSDQDVKYIKIDCDGGNTPLARSNEYSPILVEDNQSALKEISNLEYIKAFETNSKVTDSSV